MPAVKLRATSLPAGDGDGLTYHAKLFVAEPHTQRLMLALVNTRQIVTDADDGEQTAVLRLRRVECILDPDDARELMRIMMRANERRKGGTVLPMQTEDIEAIFAEWSADEGDTVVDTEKLEDDQDGEE